MYFTRKQQYLSAVAVLLPAVALSFDATPSRAAVTPASVSQSLALGQVATIGKVVDTPAIPPRVEVCLLEDETGSFGDDINHLQQGSTASDIFEGVLAIAPGAKFGVAGFRDYPVWPYGAPSDWVYRLISPLSSDKGNWLYGIATLTAGGGADGPEAQYDAIVSAASGAQNCGWSGEATATKVLVVTTDAPFHTPSSGAPHQNNLTSTTNVLQNSNVRLIGLKAPGAGTELDNLALATGGSVEALSSDGSNIAAAIIAGLSNLPMTVTPVPIGCGGLGVSFAPPSASVVSGSQANFVESVVVTDPSVAGSTVACSVAFRDGEGNALGTQSLAIAVPLALSVAPPEASHELGLEFEHVMHASVTSGVMPIPGALVEFTILSGPNAGQMGSATTNSAGAATLSYLGVQGPAGAGLDEVAVCTRGVCDTVSVLWRDTLAPVASCVPSHNPAGNVPPAGGGGNPDGFWEIGGEDLVDPALTIQVVDTVSGAVFGPFPTGTTMKYVQAPGAPNKIREASGEVDWMITGNGDARVVVTDFAGNRSSTVCLVPPPPM